MMTTVTGEPGDVLLAFHDVWHGRRANLTDSQGLLYQSQLFALGSRCDRLKFSIPASVFESLGPELQRLMNPDEGFTLLANGKMQVVATRDEPRPHELIRALDHREAPRTGASGNWVES
jgi:hypothetical protein